MDNATKQAFDSVMLHLDGIHEDVQEIKSDIKSVTKDQVIMKVDQSALKTKVRIVFAILSALGVAGITMACRYIFFGV